MSNFSRKAVAVGLTVATVVWAAGATLSASAASLTEQQVQSILSMLQAFGADPATISNVQAALTGQPASTTTVSATQGSAASYTFTKDLTLGSKGADVKALQQFLNSKGYTVAKSGAGSPGNESEYFGPATKAALIKFQKDNNITPASGYFGPKTRAVVNSMGGGVIGTTGGVVLPAGFNVSLASDTPAAGTVVAGQTVADLAHFKFSNGNATPVTVTSLTVTRIGVSSDNSLLNVYLYQGNNRLTDGASVVNSKVTFTNSSGLFVVPANSTVTVSVKADIVSGISGQSVSFAIMSASDVVASGATVQGTFPVSGNLMNVAQVSDLVSVTMSGTPTGAGATINAGTVNAIVWSQPINVAQRTAYLKYVRFRQVGSVQTDALQNLGLYIDGSQVATANMQSDGTVVFDMTSNPVSLNTGSHQMELHADIVKGSSRNFSFSIQTPSDIVIYDSNYGVAVSPSLSNATFPMSSSQTTINSGTISITTDPNFTSNQTLSQASNVTLGQWVAKAYGEDVRVGQWQVQLNLTGTSTAGNYINNIAIYVNGAQVGSAQNWTVGSSTNASTTLTFGSGNLFTMTAGTQYVVAVKGDTSLASSTTGIVATLVEVKNQSQGLTSYTTFPSSTVSHTGQSLSFSNSSLTIAVNPAYSNQTIGSNVSKQKIGSYVLQASNIDSIQVTQITVGLGGTLALTNLSNIYVSDNTNPQYPQSQNTFAVNFTIPAGQSHTVDVFADIGNATGTVTTSISVAARAVTSNTQVGSAAGTYGQTISVGQGVLSAPTLVQSQSLQSQYVIGGTSGQQLAVYNFVSTGGGANVTDLTFQVVSGTSSPTISGITVGGQSGTFAYNGNGATGTVTISGLSISVPGNDYAGVNVPVTVTFVPVGANGSASGVTTTLALTSVKYTSGGTTVTTSTNVAANTVMLVGAAPTISVSNTSASGLVAGQNKLFEFTVGSQGGTISVGTTTFNVSASGIATPTVASAQLYVGSNPLSNSSCNTVATTSGWTVTCTFPSDYRISGSGQTFDLYATVGGTFANSGQSSVTTQLGAANTFSWYDVSGNGGPYTAANSTYLYNYPTATWSVHN